MKNSLSFGIVWLGLATSNIMMATTSKQDFENITAAVKASNLKKVENLLALYTLNAHQKKSLLEEATTILTEKKQNLRLKNPRNSIKATVVGTFLATYGSLAGAFLACSMIYPRIEQVGFKQYLKEITRFLLLANGDYGWKFIHLSPPLSLAAGIYLINKGLNCATIVASRNDAEKIRELIEQHK